MKKTLAIILCLVMVLSMVGCGGSSAPAKKDTFVVGICQLVQHEALDAATKGFKDAIIAELGDKVTFNEQNASGDSATCATICNQFVSEKVDLIMANATPALQAAAASTDSIPILGTSVTDYATALDISNWTGATGKNISGTSDLAPLDGQAAMFSELLPDAQNIGILFCSAEANSKYQADTVEALLKDAGFNVKLFTFADSNDIANVVSAACSECDALYIPTDNTAAAATETISNVALPAEKPIICGEEGLCAGCGIATLSISYYDLGFATGKMAVEILKNGKDVSTMEVQFAPNFTKKFNADICSALGITVPADYVAIG
jgi:putative ABC transport system substrate-binding protein